MHVGYQGDQGEFTEITIRHRDTKHALGVVKYKEKVMFNVSSLIGFIRSLIGITLTPQMIFYE
jgi:hypothetical protein